MRLTCLALFGGFLVACGGRANVQCESDGNCDLSGGGKCVAASTGNEWCAYPDPECPSGYRYSNDDVGDGVGGVCVAGTGVDAGVDAHIDGPPVAVTHRLTVMVGGSGTGSVVSTPAGLTCAAGTCTADYAEGTSVALAASSTTGTFLGWSNDCTGAGACNVAMDHDRVVTALFGVPGEALWSTQLGGTQDDVATAVTTDSAGNLIVVGNFSGTFTTGATTLTSNGGQDFFVAKLAAADGSVAWIKSFGGTDQDSAFSVALDASDNIYIAGNFLGSINFGAGTIQSAGNVDGFALKLDSGGTYQWAKSIGGTVADNAIGVAVHGSVVAVSGSWAGSMTINGMTVMNAGSAQVYLVTFGTDGSAGLVKTISGSGTSSGRSIAIDSAGNYVVCGTLSGAADFGNGTVNSNLADAFVAKYSPTGSYLLAKVLGSSGNADGCATVAIGPLDDIFLVGGFSGSVAFGGASPLDTGAGSMVVARYSAAGAYQWAKSFGDSSAQLAPRSGAVNSSGDIVTAGYFCGSVTFGSHQLSSVGTCGAQDFDIFAVRLSGTDGSPLASMRAGGSSQDIGNGIAQTSDGRHFVAGAFQGFADFGGTSRTSAGQHDAIILALAPL